MVVVVEMRARYKHIVSPITRGKNKMSAYVVDDDTINKIVAFLQRQTWSSSFWNLNFLSILGKSGYDLRESPGCERLARAMFNLNYEAVNRQYGKSETTESRLPDFHYRQITPATPVRTYKALVCWLYQCHDGIHEGIPEDLGLYQIMREIGVLLCHTIVCELPEYKEANWG